MKNLCLIALPFLLLLQACVGSTDDNAGADKRNDSLATAIYMDKGDVQFAISAAKINFAEIELGKLAVQKGADKRVKNFGAQLVKDHTKRAVKLQVIASAKKIDLPITADTIIKKDMAELAKNTGKGFDKAYLDYIIKDHKTGIKLLEDASKNVVDADLRKYAAQNLLILNRHLDAINSIQGSQR